MPSIEIRDMTADDEYFVSTCTHVDDIPDILHRNEIDACAKTRISWLKDMHQKGARVKVAYINSEPAGFLHLIPVEVCPWGPLGSDLMVIPCLVALKEVKGRGVGRELIAEAERETERQGRKGVVTKAYYSDFWFMPAPFFEMCGFSVVERRKVTSEVEKKFLNEAAILWKILDPTAEPPRFLNPNYQFRPIPGKVVVDLFWNAFCQTSGIEAQRVREVAAEFGDSAVLNKYPAEDPRILSRYQNPRGIYINGKEIGWGYEAPKEGIREAIEGALGG